MPRCVRRGIGEDGPVDRYRERIVLLRDNDDSAGAPVSPLYEAASHGRRVTLDA